MVSQKEKKEIAIALGSVVVFAVVGVLIMQLTESRQSVVVGAAIDNNLPTQSGILLLLKEHCTPVSGSGTCNEICGEKSCFPIENSCSASVQNNQCICCTAP